MCQVLLQLCRSFHLFLIKKFPSISWKGEKIYHYILYNNINSKIVIMYAGYTSIIYARARARPWTKYFLSLHL